MVYKWSMGKMKQELKTLIEEQRKKSFIDQSKATDEEALGILISTYMEWDSRIIDVFKYALEDANFHSFVTKIEEWKKEEGL